jgi:uncharacterized MAPEG superfamily protein
MRIIYLPVYALGIPNFRTVIFLLSIVGIGLTLWPLLLP